MDSSIIKKVISGALTDYTQEQLTEICEDAFVNIKEACMRLQERTRCSNEVVIEMLNNVAEFYVSSEAENEEINSD